VQPSAYLIQVSGSGSATVAAGSNLSLTITGLTSTGATFTGMDENVSLSFYGFSNSPNGTAPTVTDMNGTARTVTASVGTPNTTITFSNGVATVSGTANGVFAAYNGTGSALTLNCSDGTATSASGTGAAGLSVTVNPAASSQLVFTTSAQTIPANTPSGTITVQREDPFGNPNTADATLTVNLSSTSGSGVFWNTGHTATLTSVTINNGSSAASFTYEDSALGAPTITAAGGGLTSATQQITVTLATLTWSASPATFNWNTNDANWTGGSGVYANGDAVIFNDTGSASSPINLVGALNPVTVTVNTSSDSYTFSTTGSGTIGGSATLSKSGSSTLTISTANSYTGATTVSGGVVDVQNSTALGAGATTVSSGAAVQVDGSGLSIGEAITLNGSGISSGGALRNLANSNTWSGAITLAGNSRINSDAGSLILSGSSISGTAANLTVGGSGNETIADTIATTSGTLTKDGSGTVTLNGNNTYSGGTTLSAGVLSISTEGASSGSLGAVPASATATNIILNGGDLLSGGTLALNANRGIGIGAASGGTGATAFLDAAAGQTFTINGGIASTGNTGANSLTVNGVSGSGTVVLGGTDSYTGGIVVDGGSLVFSVGAAIPASGVLTLNNTAAVTVTTATSLPTVTVNGVNSITGNGTSGTGIAFLDDVGTLTLFTSSGSGVFDLTGTMSGSGNLVLGSSSMTLRFNGTAGDGSAIFNLGTGSAAALVRDTETTAIALGGLIGGSGTQLQGDSSSGGAAMTYTIGGANANTEFDGVIADGSAGNVTLVKTGLGALTLAGANTFSGGTTVSGGTLLINNTTGSGAGSGSVTAASGTTLGGTGTISGKVTWDSGSLALFTAGSPLTVGVAALNSNSVTVNVPGSTPLGGGIYTLMNYTASGSTGAFNTSAPAYTGAGVAAQTLSSISTGGGAVTLTVISYAGVQRTWAGDGLTNAWDFTSVNWLNGTAPSIFSNGDFVTFNDAGSSTPPVNLTTTLEPEEVVVNATSNYTFSGAGEISGAAVLVKTNTGTLTILTDNNYSGVTTIGQGILQLGNGTTSGSLGTGQIQDSGSLVLNLPGSNSFANLISGTGQLVQAGSGTLALTANNSYTGGTTISAGTLQINTGAWFGGGNVTNNGALVFDSSGNSSVGAAISGTGSVTLNNSGTVTLTGNNTYSGGTTVNRGALLVNNSTGSGVGTGPVVVAGGGTLGGGGVIGGSVTINSGGIFAPGNPVGTLAVNGDFTASGAILNYTLGIGSDLTVVRGNLNLSGTLNVTNNPGFFSGAYTLFTYGGTLTLGSLAITLPSKTTATIDTSTPGQVNLVVTTSLGVPAFPGALGFGQFATGGRGGTVYHVTTLADSGAGSFRDAVSQPNRVIIFDVGGTITLASAVSCSSSLTIAGQTAPGGGIAIIGHEVSFSVLTNDIVRFLRFRPGSTADTTEDGINMGDGTNLIFDHISIEFAPYNNIDATGNYTGGNQITIQNSILADPIGQQFNAHTQALNNTFSWCYNILSSAHDRNPLAKVNTVFVNNVVYNYQAGYTVADTSGNFSHDIVSNYFITGPATTSAGDDFYQFDSGQSVYASGNLLDNNLNGTLGGSATAPEGVVVLTSPWSPFTADIPTYSTAGAYRHDVSLSGALPLDQVDQLVFNDVTSLGTSGKGPGLWGSQADTGLGNDGYGVITNGILPLDSDGDGMPDYWKLAVGLSLTNSNDAMIIASDGYANIEHYLNWLAEPHALTRTDIPVDVDLWPYTAGFTNASPVYSVSGAVHGAVVLNSGHIAQFTPAANFMGLGSFNFSVLASDGSAMTNTVTVCVTPPPQFGGVMAVGANLVLSGSNGVPLSNYFVLASTNLALPPANWTVVSTNQFDAAGNFIFTNAINTHWPQSFYILQLPP
jgi:autotransporter-associated beta strand protein